MMVDVSTDDLRALIFEETGKKSWKELNRAEYAKVTKRLEQEGNE
jgi:hypothetical protein